jgi:hypothetical protein
MDSLGFFKERNYFLEIKIRFPLNPPGHTGSSKFGSAAARRLAARVRPGGHWLPHAIPRWAVQMGAVRAGVWPGKGVVGRTGSGRIGYGHSCMWFPLHMTIPCGFEGGPRYSTECP